MQQNKFHINIGNESLCLIILHDKHHHGSPVQSYKQFKWYHHLQSRPWDKIMSHPAKNFRTIPSTMIRSYVRSNHSEYRSRLWEDDLKKENLDKEYWPICRELKKRFLWNGFQLQRRPNCLPNDQNNDRSTKNNRTTMLRQLLNRTHSLSSCTLTLGENVSKPHSQLKAIHTHPIESTQVINR